MDLITLTLAKNYTDSRISTISTKYQFVDISARDTYFTTNFSEITKGLLVNVGADLYSWSGITSPLTYDNTLWLGQTLLIKGEKGDTGLQGVQGIQGFSDYELAKQGGYTGTQTTWLTTLDSCLGKFDSLAQLKAQYPTADSHKFAIIKTVGGQTSMAFYNTSLSDWDVTVFASETGVVNVTVDSKSVGKDVSENLQIQGFNTATTDTILTKNGIGEVGYVPIKKNNANSFTKIASQEYVDEVLSEIQGGIVLQDSSYNATTNTPDIKTVVTDGKAFAYLVNVSGTQNLGGTSYTFAVNDWVIKTENGSFLKIDNTTTTVTWGTFVGDITTQTDLINKLNEYAKIDDLDLISATKTYSAKHILELLDGKRKVFIQSDVPTGAVKDDLWVDTVKTVYTLMCYTGSAWASVGNYGLVLTNWSSGLAYEVNNLVLYLDVLYKCTTANSDLSFVDSSWKVVGGAGGGTLNIQYLTTDGTIPIWNYMTLCDCTTGNITVTIPASLVTSLDTSAVMLVGAYGTKGTKGIRVNNMGRSGAFSFDAQQSAKVMDAEFTILKPTLTIIELGLNDAQTPVPIATYKTQMQNLITNALAQGDCLLLAPTMYSNDYPYRDVQRQLAIENNCAFIDIGSRWGGSMPTLFKASDGFHPNEIGDFDMASAILRVIDEY